MDGLVTVATYTWPAEAKLARSVLEGEDIPCLLPDEHVLDVEGGMSIAFGGCRLCVPASYVGRARAALDAMANSAVSDEELEAQALAGPRPYGSTFAASFSSGSVK